MATYRGQGDYFDTKFVISESMFDPATFDTATKGYVDDRSIDFLIDYLENPQDKPFAIVLGLKGVHEPFEPKPEHDGSYSDRELDTAANWMALPPWGDFPAKMPKDPLQRSFWTSILETARGVDTSVG